MRRVIWPREPRKKIKVSALFCSHPMVTCTWKTRGAAAAMFGTEHQVVNLLFCRVVAPHMHTHTAASCVAVAEAVADGGFCIAKASRA